MAAKIGIGGESLKVKGQRLPFKDILVVIN